MTKQIKHMRTSKKGKPFVAGSKKIVKVDISFETDVYMFRKHIQFIEHLVDEVKFSLKPDGLYADSMDPANVAAFRMHYKAIKAIGKTEFKLKTRDLFRILKDIKPGTSISVTRLSNKLVIKDLKSMREIELIENITRDFVYPSLKFEYEFSMPGKELFRVLKECSKYSEVVQFFGNPKGPKIIAQGENGKFSEYVGTKIKGDELQIAKYSLEYLKTLNPIFPLYQEVMLRFTKDMPLEIELSNNLAEIKFLLAPRVGED